MSWYSTWAFALLPVAVFLVAWAYRLSRKKSPTIQYSSLSILKGLPRPLRTRLLWLPSVVFLLAMTLLIAGLARPQRADTKIRKNVEGIDIMLVLDVSDSMLIEDMKPNRLEVSKQMLMDFVKRRTTDRLGLVVFSGESYTRVPLTLDYKILLQSIEQIKISRNIKMGTAIGVALANGTARLKDSTARSRVMVFLTDGENNSGTIDPETALDIAKGFGLRIYTIGAGRDGDAQLPVETQDAFGRKVKRYQPIHSKVNDELLGKMASDTGGKYYRATDNESLKKVFTDIDRLEKTKIDVNQYTKYAELYQSWVLWGLMALFFSWFLQLTVFRRVP
ncbi:MAG: VWA domain-containing protein [Deltaproteobacteria bacterium]|nr:VWA domain-containing protein [Deltaproteobacteria bacterium]